MGTLSSTTLSVLARLAATGRRILQRIPATHRRRNDFAGIAAGDIALIAHDVGVTSGDLAALSRGTDAAELPQMLQALQIDVAQVRDREPLVLRDLQRVCTGCRHKAECRYDLASGRAAARFAEYCGNAHTLNALQAEKAAGLA